ncbi:MAG: hypothetical protein CSA51_01590 [Gammaproteobacteria bacterium]|nr:MAG: hypothetical protein CSA51_01590 [Gammaproteobacteria bacterium]
MLTTYPYLYLARIQMEATTPVAIQTGQADLLFDSTLVRDANGLPTLPATSIRGVLRHLLLKDLELQNMGKEKAQAIFGYGHQDETGRDEAKSSQLQVSWGMLHDSRNIPVEGRIDLAADPVLDELSQMQPVKRERVRLNDQGCAEDNGKFDVTAAPKGCRFTFELKYWSDQAEDTNWQHLLNMLQQPAFRLGSNTRSGFGAFCIQSIKQRCFDLTDPVEVKAWQNLGRSLANDNGLTPLEDTGNTQASAAVTATLNLTAEGFIRIGGGDFALEKEREADLYTQSEKYIHWDENNTAVVSARVPLIPASAIKGALAHRITYHHNRIKGKFTDQIDDQTRAEIIAREQADGARKLFGYANNTNTSVDGKRQVDGAAGQVLLNDIYLDDQVKTSQLWHNRIDRFTGGVIDGALYSEEVLFEPAFKLQLTFLQPQQLDDEDKQALQASLDDLCQGRLPIGASGARGMGSCTGTLSWSDDGQWIGEKN